MKFNLLSEKIIKSKNAMRHSYVAKNAPSDHEIGWLGHKRFKGSKDKVQVSFDPNDPTLKDNYVYHTHPAENPTQLHSFPSEQDLISSIKQSMYGLMGSVIFSGPYYTVVVPTEKAVESYGKSGKLNSHKYYEALKRGDIEDSIRQLDILGFDIETGEINI